LLQFHELRSVQVERASHLRLRPSQFLRLRDDRSHLRQNSLQSAYFIRPKAAFAAKGALRPRQQFGHLTVDRVSHSVQRNGHAIDLSPKEFALLEFLMRHAGQPVTRSAIIEQVWKLNFDTMTNVVDVYIHYLRRKVDTGYDRALIRTVRGVGYQIGGSSGTSRSAVQAATAPI
jgi:DNA-binding response OmpR family regulator